MAQVDPMTGLTIDEERTMVSAISRTWWVLLFIGIVSVIVGVLMLVRPAGSTWVLAVILAIYLVLSGIFSIVRAFSSGLTGGYRALLIIGGAIGLLLGLLMFRLGPDEKIELLGIFVGVWFLFAGVNALFAASSVKDGRGWAIFSGIIYLLAGIVLLVNEYSIEVFVWVAGIWLIVVGLFEIISSFSVKSMEKKAAS